MLNRLRFFAFLGLFASFAQQYGGMYDDATSAALLRGLSQGKAMGDQLTKQANNMAGLVSEAQDAIDILRSPQMQEVIHLNQYKIDSDNAAKVKIAEENNRPALEAARAKGRVDVLKAQEHADQVKTQEEAKRAAQDRQNYKNKLADKNLAAENKVKAEIAAKQAAVKAQTDLIRAQKESDLEMEIKMLENEDLRPIYEKKWKLEAEQKFEASKVKANAMIEVQRKKTEGDLLLQERFWRNLTNLTRDNQAMMNVAKAGSTVSVAAITAIYGVPFTLNALKSYFVKPILITETSRWTTDKAKDSLNPANLWAHKSHQKPASVILSPALKERMNVLGNMITNTYKRKGVFQHIVLHGKPGTGKTMWAKEIAKKAGMDYAILDASRLLQYETKEAVQHVVEVFKWLRTSSKGMILFIDEADAVLEKRSSLKGDRGSIIPIVNQFLVETGTETDKFCVVLATNRYDVLDDAVLTRIGEEVHFTLPGAPEIKSIIKQYVRNFITDDMTLKKQGVRIKMSLLLNDDCLTSLAERFEKEEMSGRDLMYFVNGLKATILAQKKAVLTEKLLERAVNKSLEKKSKETMQYNSAKDGVFVLKDPFAMSSIAKEKPAEQSLQEYAVIHDGSSIQEGSLAAAAAA